jgi:hypothetical protein
MSTKVEQQTGDGQAKVMTQPGKHHKGQDGAAGQGQVFMKWTCWSMRWWGSWTFQKAWTKNPVAITNTSSSAPRSPQTPSGCSASEASDLAADRRQRRLRVGLVACCHHHVAALQVTSWPPQA